MPGLERFKTAQGELDSGFDAALSEIEAGRKRGHWVWYVFPQLAGLGVSAASRTYAIRDIAEAKAYLRDAVLCGRLLAMTTAVAEQVSRGMSLEMLMGSWLDAQKLVSSLTLFGEVARSLHTAEGLEAGETVADAADRVLDAAQREGIPRCRFTRAKLADRA